MPVGGRLDELMRTMRRWGIARTMADDEHEPGEDERDQPFVVAIRPGILEVLNESALLRLAQFADAAPLPGEADSPDPEEDTDDGPEGMA